ncbi:type II toxin-antitoxin system HicB family antitoxin [uncultured Methanospirillum sp.]|uniref:type II toxin-antitoxin system HicB family antitoxin n=1 Tax=uncultured Methanospirillum sp. TaxID=262503 RepID=UPI0029C6A7A0|nr:type II toxin-antitoxin system HicB family antitoxin [uncultured Methanospirillum sp.]
MMQEYTIIIHPAEEGGFWVEVPTLPGCFSQGESIEEAMRNVKEAIDLHIECLKEENEPVPIENDLIISRVQVNPVQA